MSESYEEILTEFGLMLKGILAGSEVLTEKLLPEFQITIAELFRCFEASGPLKTKSSQN